MLLSFTLGVKRSHVTYMKVMFRLSMVLRFRLNYNCFSLPVQFISNSFLRFYPVFLYSPLKHLECLCEVQHDDWHFWELATTLWPDGTLVPLHPGSIVGSSTWSGISHTSVTHLKATQPRAECISFNFVSFCAFSLHDWACGIRIEFPWKSKQHIDLSGLQAWIMSHSFCSNKNS